MTTSDPKFTPGPWEWDGTPWSYNTLTEAPWIWAYGGNKCVLKGEIQCSEADAHLLRAAPEMYGLLDELHLICSETDDDEMARTIAQLLSRARGESEPTE
ncbi:MAG: hypothetical protein KAJ19_11390 [Gammaproteobacteria bacterium]|nr:hypothetical protein [Gammaproteobacteria bacterium]